MSGWVYFLQHGGKAGPIKIGWTGGNPHARRRALQTGAPEALTLLTALPGSLETEHELHETFKAERIRDDGEWFAFSVRLQAFVTGVMVARRGESQPEDDDEDEDLPAEGFGGLTEEQVHAIRDLMQGVVLRASLYRTQHLVEAHGGAPPEWLASIVDELRYDVEGWLKAGCSDYPGFERALSEHELRRFLGWLDSVLASRRVMQ